MKTPLLAALLFSTSLLTGCTLAPEERHVAAVTGTRGEKAPPLDNHQTETLLDGVAERLYTAGYTSAWGDTSDRHPAHPYSYLTPWVGGRVYYAWFTPGPHLVCHAQFRRAQVEVFFDEQAIPPRGSHPFPSTAEERQKMRATAESIRDYLKRSLPSFYQVTISFAPAGAAL